MSVWKKYARPLLILSILLLMSVTLFSYFVKHNNSKLLKYHLNTNSLLASRKFFVSANVSARNDNKRKNATVYGEDLNINAEKIMDMFHRMNLTLPEDTLRKLQMLSKGLKGHSQENSTDKWKHFHNTGYKRKEREGINQDKRHFLTRPTTDLAKARSTDERQESCKSCFQNNFKILINEETFCEKFEDLDLVIVIATAMESEQERMTIRKTWGKLCTVQNKLACVFTFGIGNNPTLQQNLLSESKIYGDIIQFEFKDSYSNLTYKTMSSLRWVTSYCPAAKYVMKTDGDMYINTENLPIMLSSGAPKTDFMGGYCWVSTSPKRDKDSKWYVSFKSFAKSKFPPMCSGTGYVISIDAVHKLLNISKNIPYFHLEDVYVAICMQKLNIHPINIQGFSNMKTAFYACTYRNSVFTSHYVDTHSLENYWKQSRKCPKENRKPEHLYRAIPLHIP